MHTLQAIERVIYFPDYVIEVKMPLFSKARPRLTKSGHAYMPESYRLAQAEMRHQIREQWRLREPLMGPIALYVEMQGEARIDADNAVGALMDAAGPSKKEAGVLWQDDRVSVIPLVIVDWKKAKKDDSLWRIHILDLAILPEKCKIG
jgi:Holliday junction resolvase RusA-like endonuclease